MPLTKRTRRILAGGAAALATGIATRHYIKEYWRKMRGEK